jgi:hypothetical protein
MFHVIKLVVGKLSCRRVLFILFLLELNGQMFNKLPIRSGKLLHFSFSFRESRKVVVVYSCSTRIICKNQVLM